MSQNRPLGTSVVRSSSHNDAQKAPLLNASHSTEMERGRPAVYRVASSGGHPVSIHHATSPLITRPTFPRRSTMRSISPTELRVEAARQRYTYAAIALFCVLVSFTVQTEVSSYVQRDLGWNKSYCMMYFTHSSWILLWLGQLAFLRFRKSQMPWNVFWRRHLQLLRSTANMVKAQSLDVDMLQRAPRGYLITTIPLLTCALTVAGLSWYVAVNMTTPSDLTAIYNCSAFFAYLFSVPILHEPMRIDKSIAVAIAILGVLTVAYGDSRGGDADAQNRLLGNLVIGVGSVLYGLYEVMYKRLACPPEGTSPGRGMIFSNTMAASVGLFTIVFLWIPLPILHALGWETFELPWGSTAFWVAIAVLANVAFSGSFLILVSLTSPVLSSVASLLTIFIVAIVHWLLTGEPLGFGSVVGGLLIIVAFLMLSWSTWREMQEHAALQAKSNMSDSSSNASHSDGEDEEEEPYAEVPQRER